MNSGEKMNKLIIIEGLDGSGKSTQTELLCNYLAEKSVDFRKIKLPDYEHDSSKLVKMYLSGDFGTNPNDVNAYAASLLYAVDRFASYNIYWKNDYLSGKVIISDRYATSNAVHQMVKLDKTEWDKYLEWSDDLEYEKVGIPRPSIVIYLDMPIEVSQKLMSSRYKGDEAKKDVHEANVAYLHQCAETAAYTAKKQGWHVIRCSNGDKPRAIDDIQSEIRALVDKELFDV